MAKKKGAAKPVQTTIPRAAKQVKAPLKSTAKFVSLSVTAVIPVQAYGNIQPKIEVTAATFEEARAFAMPLIEGFYRDYAETKPGFIGKVTEVVKEVAPATPTPAAIAQTPAETVVVEPVNTTPKPESVIKAEKAITLAATEDAATRIQDQIEKSTKIPPEFKPELLKLCLKRRGELDGK